MIKFHQYYATNGVQKVKVFYSLDNRIDGRKAITIYAKDYGWKSFKDVFGELAKNDTDLMTDYFEQSHAVIFEDHPLYAEAREKIEGFLIKISERRNK